MMFLSSSLFALASLTLIARAQDNGLTVATQQGPVTGELATQGVRRWLGIPYAAAQRWKMAESFPQRNETFMATQFGTSCPQALNSANVEILALTGANVTFPEDENCLTLNVWAPSTDRKQNASVMIWAHGGHSQFGTGNSAMTDGQNIVRDQEDIIIVTVNYRLNIFGHPGAPQMAGGSETQNFGIVDFGTAVHWVHDNIITFGGDPDRITLFGQSGGAAAIDAYTYVHPNDVIAKGIIQQSGNLFADGGSFVSNPLNPDPWNTVAATVGCGNVASDTQLECMKAVPFRTLEDAVISTNTKFTLITDDLTVFSDVANRSATGKFLQVPYLSGTTKNEQDIFIVANELVNMGFGVPALTPLLSDVGTQLTFTCPISQVANNRVQTGMPTWRYQYQAVFADISTHFDLRSYHASEIPIVFGTFNSTDPNEIAFSKYVQGAWVAFARNPTQGLLDYGWPTYSPDTNSIALLGNALNVTGVTFTSSALLDFTCAHHAQAALTTIQQELTGILNVSASVVLPSM